MFSRALAWLGVVGVVSSVGACGSSGGSGPVPEAELPGRIAVLFCDSVADCCTNAARPFDATGCKTTVARQLKEELGASSSRVTYDPSAAGDCVDELAASMQCGWQSFKADSVCERVWRGTVPLGKPCLSTSECAPSPFEHVSCSAAGDSQRLCTASPRAPRGIQGEVCSYTCPVGGSCDSPADLGSQLGGGVQTFAICFAVDGLFCKQGACAKLVELGGACTDPAACRGAAYCDATTTACKPLKTEDAICADAQECESGVCQGADLLGGTASGRCAPAGVASAAQCNRQFSDDRSSGPPPSGL